MQAKMPDEDNPVDSVGSITQNYRALLGYRISEWSDGEAVMDLDMRSALHNTAGVMHGGAIASLIDAACGHAATWSDDPARPRFAVTLNLNISFTGQVIGGRVRAHAKIKGGGRKIVFCVADVVDGNGNLVAFGEGTFRYRSGSER